MADVKWIKITTDMFDDEKIDFISSLPEGDAMLVVWIRLLTMAGKCNAGGYIFLTEKIPYTDEMLASKFKKPLNVVRLAIETFVRLEMIELNNGKIHITNWIKHQNIEGMERARELTRQRVARHRNIKKLPCNVTSNATVTPSNAIDIDIDIELDKENNNITPHEREVLKILKEITGYPYDYEADLKFIREISIDFPNVDLTDKLKDWKTWLIKKPLTTKSNPRLQIRNWCKPKWGKEQQINKTREKTHEEQLEFIRSMV